jgi:hypothetical protein
MAPSQMSNSKFVDGHNGGGNAQGRLQLEVHVIMVAQRIISLCNQMVLVSLHNGLTHLALHFLVRAVSYILSLLKNKADLAIHELRREVQARVLQWKGRILMMNLQSLFHYKFGHLNSCLEAVKESQKIASVIMSGSIESKENERLLSELQYLI